MKKVFIALLFFVSSLFAQLDYSKKKIKLLGEKKETVSKRVSIKNIEKIGYKEYLMIDPYTKKRTNYGGVTLDNFVKVFAKPNVKEVIFTAIDGYKVSFVKKEWKRDVVLLSTRVNKKHVGYEHKGPLRVVFPNFDSIAENYANNLPKWIWMIKSIEFK